MIHSSGMTRRQYAFAIIAAGMLALVLCGFSFTYWGPLLRGQRFPTMIHAHSLLWHGWFLLFVIQAMLVQQARTDLHRPMGALVSLYTIILIVFSLGLAIHVVGRDAHLVTNTFASVPTIVPLTQILLFSAFFGIAVVKRRQLETHKRLIVLAGLVGMTPALARISIGLTGAPHVPLLFAVSNLLVVAIAVADWRQRQHLHAVYLWGGLAIILVRIVRIPLAMSPAWKRFADSLAVFAT